MAGVRYVALLLIVLLAGCANEDLALEPVGAELVLVQYEPVEVEGGSLTYLGSLCLVFAEDSLCTEQFVFNATGSDLSAPMNVGETGTSVNAKELMYGDGSGYPEFNLSVLDHEAPVRRDGIALMYWRAEKNAHWYDGPRTFLAGQPETEGFDHGLVIDDTLYKAPWAEYTTDLSRSDSGLQAMVFFETDRLRVVSEDGEIVLLPNESTMIPLYRSVVRVRLEPIVGSWISEEMERYYALRRASRIEEASDPIVLPLNHWVDAGPVELKLVKIEVSRRTSERSYLIEFRFADDTGGRFSIDKSTRLHSATMGHPFFNVSGAEPVGETDVAVTIEYFANAKAERGDKLIDEWRYCRQDATQGILINGMRRFACPGIDTYDLSFYGVPVNVTFAQGAATVNDVTLEDGESTVVDVTAPAISVQLVPITGSWERR